MQRWLESYLLAVWYGSRRGAGLRPFGALYGLLMRLRRALYRSGVLRSRHPGVPVSVVGNFTVGGTGKTPLTLWLVARLLARGRHPAVISRGYGGARQAEPVRVAQTADPRAVGDEPLLLARRLPVPVWIHRQRYRAAVAACGDGADVLVCDDGLQHLALARDAEIAVVDGTRRVGNGRCLPAGPLREARVDGVDVVIVNGGESGREPSMQLVAREAVSVADGTRLPLARFAGQQVHAVAAIGHPQRFFDTLRAHGAEVRLIPAVPGRVRSTPSGSWARMGYSLRPWVPR